MEPIVIVEDIDLRSLLSELADMTGDPTKVYRLRFAVDGGIKVKVNEAAWSRAYGRVVSENPEPAAPRRGPCRSGYASDPGTHNNQVRAYGRCSCWCHGGK